LFCAKVSTAIGTEKLQETVNVCLTTWVLIGLSKRTLPIKAKASLFEGGLSKTSRTEKSNFRAWVSEINALRSAVEIIVKDGRVKKGREEEGR